MSSHVVGCGDLVGLACTIINADGRIIVDELPSGG